MTLISECARAQTRTARDEAEKLIKLAVTDGILENREAVGDDAKKAVSDAAFLTGDRRNVIAVTGLPYAAPVCQHMLSAPVIGPAVAALKGNLLIEYQKDGTCRAALNRGAWVCPALPGDICGRMAERIALVLKSPGELNDRGELILDLKACPVGPYYAVNLLLGSRAGYPDPLITTPKSAVDAFGRGSFRASGAEQVLATRYVLDPSENGEPANRQFYLAEHGRQIFYSGNVSENVAKAACRHSQNHTEITYETEDGLEIRRLIFLLPQEDGMPSAVEAQRITILNKTDRERELSLVATGVFGIAGPGTVAGDIVYANLVMESDILYDDGVPAVLSLNPKPAEERNKKRFALLIKDGEPMDRFCTSWSDFVGTGTLLHPELVTALPNEPSRKMAPFFALEKSFAVGAGEEVILDEFVGMSGSDGDEVPFGPAIGKLYETFRDPAALEARFEAVRAFQESYPAYLTPKTDDGMFNAYVGHNLPFQVLYQTYVSRAFAWTQKSYREIGFREIQDIYASMYYLNAMGRPDLVKTLIGNWIGHVWGMGYADHNFTFAGKEPGYCSDDQLWLAQAVYRYVKLTGDTAFLRESFPVAGETGSRRELWETLAAILEYSGRISVGKHGLPLLDKADWNDTLKLDRQVLRGPEKEALYRRQLKEKGQPYGTPWENDLSESVMNACLLKIAADETAELLERLIHEEAGQTGDLKERCLNVAGSARDLSARLADSLQKNAWKGDCFARCLINDGREGGYTYLGATGDGLALEEGKNGTFFLNSYSWPILAGVADEKQIRAMLGVVRRELQTDAGLRLCTLVDFDRLGVPADTALYFPGDRENGGVFKHAAMMAVVASLKAAKTVTDEALACELLELAAFMIDRTLPYKTLEDPFILKGNPRFCTQYNNSETRENIGPMLSGTASWLTLAIYEIFGIETEKETIRFDPVLLPGMTKLAYTVRLGKSVYDVTVTADDGAFRMKEPFVMAYSGEGEQAVSLHLSR